MIPRSIGTVGAVCARLGIALPDEVPLNVRVIHVQYNVRFRRSLGRFCARSREDAGRIELSPAVKACTETRAKVLRHEIAHAWAHADGHWNHQHNRAWQRYAVRMGAAPSGYMDTNLPGAQGAPVKFVGHCETCGRDVMRARKLKASLSYRCNMRYESRGMRPCVGRRP